MLKKSALRTTARDYIVCDSIPPTVLEALAMKRSPLLILFTALLFAAPHARAHAQDSAYQRWLANEARQFKNYQEEQDKAFSKFLDREWKREPESRDTSRFLQPLPKVAPRA